MNLVLVNSDLVLLKVQLFRILIYIYIYIYSQNLLIRQGLSHDSMSAEYNIHLVSWQPKTSELVSRVFHIFKNITTCPILHYIL